MKECFIFYFFYYINNIFVNMVFFFIACQDSIVEYNVTSVILNEPLSINK